RLTFSGSVDQVVVGSNPTTHSNPIHEKEAGRRVARPREFSTNELRTGVGEPLTPIALESVSPGARAVLGSHEVPMARADGRECAVHDRRPGDVGEAEFIATEWTHRKSRHGATDDVVAR